MDTYISSWVTMFSNCGLSDKGTFITGLLAPQLYIELPQLVPGR